jgi:hypothetical protein
LYRAGKKLSLSGVDFGARFISESTALAEKVNRGEARVSLADIENVRMRCHDFLLKAYQQLETRVRDSKAVFKGLSYLTPQKVLAQATRANFQELPFPSLRAKDEIDLQYRKILFVD